MRWTATASWQGVSGCRPTDFRAVELGLSKLGYADWSEKEPNRMPTQTLFPSRRYLPKMFLVLLSILVLAVIGFGFMGYFIGLDNSGVAGALLGLWIAVASNALWFVPLAVFLPFYVRSLRYDIQDDEVIVTVGVITKSVKHVPFRTVTNIKVTRGPYDRLFGLGTLAIQTAGMSGQTGAEESLVGLDDVQAAYQLVATALRRFRTAMSPNQAGEEGRMTPDGEMAIVIDEVRAIRKLLERGGQTR